MLGVVCRGREFERYGWIEEGVITNLPIIAFKSIIKVLDIEQFKLGIISLSLTKGVSPSFLLIRREWRGEKGEGVGKGALRDSVDERGGGRGRTLWTGM